MAQCVPLNGGSLPPSGLITFASMVTAAQARAKYDQLADSYEEIFFYVADVGRQLVDFAGPPPGARVLDVGAGRGAVARAALARGCVVTAVDASPRMMERLAADHPEITAGAMDAAHLAFPDGSFDLVTAGFVVQVLDDPAAVLAEIRRVLAPGGTVALSLETQSVGRMAWLQELALEFISPGASAEPAGAMTHAGLEDLLRDAGFVDLVKESVEMPRPIADPAALWEWLAPRGISELMQALGERGPEFHRRFLSAAQEMHDDGGIALEFAATLHRGQVK